MAELAPLFRTCASRVTRLGDHQTLDVAPTANHIVVLQAADPETISRRVCMLRDALQSKGGKMRYLDWTYSPGSDEHRAIVHYSIPTAPDHPDTERRGWRTS
jgi:hypothetical protein